MQTYTYGDIVKPIMIQNEYEYYIVTDCRPFLNSKTQKKDCRYQLMRIYPVTKLSKVIYLTEIDVKGTGTKQNTKYIMDLVSKERRMKGFVDKPDYQKAIELNIYNNIEDDSSDVDESIARYDLIETIEQGVDALWDLNKFYEVFGDESYLQLKEIVLKRMNEIVEEGKRRKKK